MKSVKISTNRLAPYPLKGELPQNLAKNPGENRKSHDSIMALLMSY